MGGLPVFHSPEQNLTEVLSEIGPVVAIGRPGEKLPPLGAARLYVCGDDWQTEVRSLLADPALVVLRLGSTEGFHWEVRHVFENLNPQRVLIDIPIKDSHWQQFSDFSNSILPVRLPARKPNARFLVFDDGWQPVFL
jgi:hypothetical protein